MSRFLLLASLLFLVGCAEADPVSVLGGEAIDCPASGVVEVPANGYLLAADCAAERCTPAAWVLTGETYAIPCTRGGVVVIQ